MQNHLVISHLIFKSFKKMLHKNLNPNYNFFKSWILNFTLIMLPTRFPALEYFMIIFNDSHFNENHGEQFVIWVSPKVIHIGFQSPDPM
jgi:hypothetical protein